MQKIFLRFFICLKEILKKEMIAEMNTGTVKLSAKEVEHFGRIYKQYLKTPTQSLKTQLIDVFKSQIEQKAATAAAAAKGKISTADYVQDLYVKFLEKLDKIVKEKTYPARALSKMLNEAEPNDSAILYKYSRMENLNPEQYEILSYQADDENNLFQKAKEVVNIAKNYLSVGNKCGANEKRHAVLMMVLDGYSFSEIGKVLDCSESAVIHEYWRAVERMSVPKVRAKINSAFYGRNLIPEKGINARRLAKQKKQEEFNIKGVWGLVKDNPPISAGEKLAELVMEKLGISEYFSKYKNQPEKILKLAEYDGCIFEIKLPAEYQCKEFIQAAEKFSQNLFGRNIFKFTD